MIKPIKKILVANRGEIAVRVIRACHDLGIVSVAICSDCDRTAYHARLADEWYHIGGSPSSESYLNQDRVMQAVKDSGADAVHPGYGFLAENATFAQRCVDEGITFIGPRPETIRGLGDKLVAREMAIKANLPVVPGTDMGADNPDEALAFAKKIGFPVLVKAAAGGGGKGMRVVESADLFQEALDSASREAKSAFGDGRVFIEKYLVRPRHVEIQILCDTHGNHLHLCERECSIQRRHQKVIEEAPSPIMTDELRERMGTAAVSIAREAGYVGAGTVEFLVDQNRSFYFLEVNTRLQVEHPVTELVTGVDLVKEQVAVAEGRELTLRQEDIRLNGHAIECRIYAEDPSGGFMPSTGTLEHYRLPAGPGVRVDSGVLVWSEIPIYYDPMIAKLCTWGRDRTEAIARMQRALSEYRISGVESTVGFHQVVLANKKFIAGDLSTGFLQEEYPDSNYRTFSPELAEDAAIAAAVDKLLNERRITISQSGNGRSRSSGWVRHHRRENVKRLGGKH
ncbi:MAG: acetyl-CoA carboxylase biotin carboxylase subunit [candidate division Zixibacteria bacterium]|nr:acetyl-CoA carboxylase biotin carboxylase subunit [candidate division Zixibacteria bacterium]